MSDRCSHQPDRSRIVPTAIAALAASRGPKLRAKDTVNGSTIVILLAPEAAAASLPGSEQRPDEVEDEGVFASAVILRPVYDVSARGAASPGEGA